MRIKRFINEVLIGGVARHLIHYLSTGTRGGVGSYLL